MSLPEFPAWLELAPRILWLAVLVWLALAAALRFRTTASGVLLASGFGAGAVLLVADSVLQLVLLKGVPYDSPVRVVSFVLTSVAGLVVNLDLAVGIALIPAALRRLREARRN